MENNLLLKLYGGEDESPIFFVPAAGSSVLSLIHLARNLTLQRPFYAFELLALGEALPSTMDQLADLCVLQLRQIQPEGPYLLGGHCWGGVLALAIAARLEAEDNDVSALILVEAVPPSSQEPADTGQAEMAHAVELLVRQIDVSLARLAPEQAKPFRRLAESLVPMAVQYRAGRLLAPIRLYRAQTHSDRVFQNYRAISDGFEEYVVAGDADSMISKNGVSTLIEKIQRTLDLA